LKETLGDERFQEPHKIQFDDKYQKFFQSLLEKTPAADRLRELLRSLSKERLSKRRFWKLLQCIFVTSLICLHYGIHAVKRPRAERLIATISL
jgi:hypothetical protein